MENKCCEHNTYGGNVYINMNKCCGDGGDVMSCTCIPSLKITIGEGGQFATLTEALEHAKTIVHNTLEIEMLGDVVETRTDNIYINGFGVGDGISMGPTSFILKGNGHTLNLNSIKSTYAIAFYLSGGGWFENVTILAQNVGRAVLAAGSNGFLYVNNGVKIVGSSLKNKTGINVNYGGRVIIAHGSNVLENFNTGITAGTSSTVCIQPGVLTFKNVTTEYSPALNTVGNNNAYICVE